MANPLPAGRIVRPAKNGLTKVIRTRGAGAVAPVGTPGQARGDEARGEGERDLATAKRHHARVAPIGDRVASDRLAAWVGGMRSLASKWTAWIHPSAWRLPRRSCHSRLCR